MLPHNNPCVDFGAKLRAARRRIGHRQTHIAERSGNDQSYVSRVEKGLANPTIGVCTDLSAAAGCFYRAELHRNEECPSQIFRLDTREINDLTLQDCGRFAAAARCLFVSELEPLATPAAESDPRTVTKSRTERARRTR
jgi:transcriptional regulator with XRE-family HTH domain